MPRHEDRVLLRHMLDHASEAVAMVQGRQRADLNHNRMLELSLIRLVEVVGEAAVRMGQNTQQLYPSIPWRQIANMRNRLIHGYSEVDLNVLWSTVVVDLPPLIALLKNILATPETPGNRT